ncbi:MAG: MMPL family transporter, partial [Desulfatitalea sp.]|nr:MMPL family transporter [Desulfatitalea sp.]NNK00847.1 MMPL family transporter [Desulfatitalea sp.]
GIRGFYVNLTDTATVIKAGFWEEGVDLKILHDDVMRIKAAEEDANHEIFVTGYPMLYAWIHHYSGQLIQILFLTFAVLAGLLFFYFRSKLGLFVPLLSGALSAVWGLGFASIMGYHIDPLILVVPLLLSARALSHGVQSLERYLEAYVRLGDKNEAIIEAYTYLYKPSVIGILTDGLGVLTIAVSTIPLMRNLAFFSSFWVISIYVSTVMLHPVLLSMLPPPGQKALKGRKPKEVSIEEIGQVRRITARPGDLFYSKICHGLIFLATGWRTKAAFALVLVIIVGGGIYSRQLKVGDTSPGRAIFYKDHPYNAAADIMNNEFVGAAEMILVVAGKEKGAMKDREVLGEMAAMQSFCDTLENVGGTVTIIDVVKRLYRMYHEGDPKWAMLPENPTHLAQMFFTLGASMAPGELDRLVSLPDYTNASITIYFQKLDHKTITDAVARLKGYIERHPPQKVTFQLVGGVMGILAAVNEEVEWSYWINLGIIFMTTFIICVIAYRSIVTAIILIIPLVVSQILCEILMLVLGIDVNINSLPVAAVGVGVGIDYSFFIMSRMAEEYHRTQDYFVTHYEAVTSTGKAVVFTATTMVAGTILWVFSSFKFQAEMGILLAFLMVVNAVGALVIVPVLVAVFGPKILLKYKVGGSGGPSSRDVNLAAQCVN